MSLKFCTLDIGLGLRDEIVMYNVGLYEALYDKFN